MKRRRFLISLRDSDNFYQQHNAQVAEDVALRLGVDVHVLYANNDAITQSEQLLNVVQSSDARPDGILCAPVGTTLMRVAQLAAGRGIAWALLNREAHYLRELRKSYQIPLFSVSVDQAEIGRIQGRQIAALLPEGGLALCVLGPTASSVGEQRHAAMMSVLPKSIQVRTLTSDWSEEGAHKAVTRWLQLRTSHELPVTLVVGQNDDMAVGARKALKEQTAGEQRTRWMSLPYIGCDCCPAAGEQWIRSGLLTASAVNPPVAGLALEMMARALEEKSQPEEQTIVAPTSYPEIEMLSSKVCLGRSAQLSSAAEVQTLGKM